jgi:23S rRNA (cytosine1962-C5)-methyltransferase
MGSDGKPSAQSQARHRRQLDLSFVLDPLKIARARNAVEKALRGYRRLRGLELRLLESDAILVTCCCSGLIGLPPLEDLLAPFAVE